MCKAWHIYARSLFMAIIKELTGDMPVIGARAFLR